MFCKNPDTYTILQPSTDFDFLDECCSYYDIEFRIVRIRLDNGTYICLATNLPEEDFPLEEIKKLYRMRWSEETSFRELVTAHAVVKTSKKTKHIYKINFATAVNICRAYLKHGGDETETMLLIQRHLTPVRYNRKYPINLRPKRNRDFMYRAAQISSLLYFIMRQIRNLSFCRTKKIILQVFKRRLLM